MDAAERYLTQKKNDEKALQAAYEDMRRKHKDIFDNRNFRKDRLIQDIRNRSSWADDVNRPGPEAWLWMWSFYNSNQQRYGHPTPDHDDDHQGDDTAGSSFNGRGGSFGGGGASSSWGDSFTNDSDGFSGFNGSPSSDGFNGGSSSGGGGFSGGF